MATANINLADGTKVVISGSPDEIARVLSLYRQAQVPADAPEVTRDDRRALVVHSSVDHKKRKESKVGVRGGAMQHIRGLIDESFFSDRRSIADVQGKLEELGRIYPLTHLSTPLRRLVVKKELRRLRNGKNWVYVNE